MLSKCPHCSEINAKAWKTDCEESKCNYCGKSYLVKMIFFECTKFWDMREDCKLTRLDLANKLNVSENTIRSWENGTTEPKPENIKKIAEVFNISIDDLFEEDYVNRISEEMKIKRETENQNKKVQHNNPGCLTILLLTTIIITLMFLITIYI